MAAAFALALRCFTESVMVSFYVWPALAVGLVVVVRGIADGAGSLALVAGLAIAVTVM